MAADHVVGVLMADAQIGDIIQIIPKDNDTPFGACLLIVSEVKSWGVICYLVMPGRHGIAPYRAEPGEFVIVGKAQYMVEIESHGD